MANDAYSRDHLGWLRQIAHDPDVTPFAVRVAVALTQYFNRETGEAFPSQDTLATDLGATAEGVRKALDRLETAGHLAIHRGRGRHMSSRYRPLFTCPKTQTAVGDNGEENPNSGLAMAAPAVAENPNRHTEKPQPPYGKTQTAVGDNGEENPNSGLAMAAPAVAENPNRHTEKPQPPYGKTQTAVGANPLSKPLEEPKEDSPKVPALLFDEQPASEQQKPKAGALVAAPGPSRFAAFWAAYPNKTGKAYAEKCFEKADAALAKQGVDALPLFLATIEQQRHWRKWREGYVPNPATWLNQGRWDDQPEPERQQRRTGGQAVQGWSAMSQAVEGLDPFEMENS